MQLSERLLFQMQINSWKFSKSNYYFLVFFIVILHDRNFFWGLIILTKFCAQFSLSFQNVHFLICFLLLFFMITFFITLLLCFFLLFSSKHQRTLEFIHLAFSIEIRFGPISRHKPHLTNKSSLNLRSHLAMPP